jgi:hypothetical protein
VAETETRHLRVLIANEKRARLELLAQVVAGLGHEVIAREIYEKLRCLRPQLPTATRAQAVSRAIAPALAATHLRWWSVFQIRSTERLRPALRATRGNRKAPFPGPFLLGGTGLEPVTPCL